jgi:hypothetical protein
MSKSVNKYEVRPDWATVVPLGDTLAVSATDGFDDRWVEAFEVVLDEHERQATDRSWGPIDFEYDSGEEQKLVLLVKRVQPQAQAPELRQTIDELVRAANTVAKVGTHVYELARELRGPQPAGVRESTPPPEFDPLATELDADAA